MRYSKFIFSIFFVFTLTACTESDSLSTVSETSSYENWLQVYPEVEEQELVSADLFDQKILYPFEEPYTQIRDELSDADLELFGPALEACRSEMAEALFAYPGYTYSDMTVGKVSTVKNDDPYVFINLYGFLDQEVFTESWYGDDQYDFLIREEECEIRKRLITVPDEEKNKIIGYLLYLPEVVSEIADQEIVRIDVGDLSMLEDGTVEVTVYFGSDIEGAELGPNTWSASYVHLNLNTGVVEVTPYLPYESPYRGEG